MTEEDYEEVCQSSLTEGSFLATNNKLMAYLDLTVAGYLCFLMNLDKYWKRKNKRTEDKFFYSTTEYIRQKTNLSWQQQNTCIKRLVQENLIKVELRGLPATHHFKILYENIHAVLKQVFEKLENFEISDTYPKDFEKNEEITGNVSVFEKPENLFLRNSKQIILNKLNKRKEPLSGTTYLSRRICNPSVLKKRFLEQKKTILVKKKYSSPVPKTILSPEIEEILAYWKGKQTLKQHGEETKSFARFVHHIDLALNGKLFKSNSTKFSVQKIKASIDHFEKAAFDDEYEPIGGYKQFLQKIIPCYFFVHSQDPQNQEKSLFIKFLAPPKLLKDSPMFLKSNIYPHTVAILEKWYRKNFIHTGNGDGELSVKTKNDLIMASEFLKKFFVQYKSKLQIESWYSSFNQHDPINFLAIQLTRAMDKKLRENDRMWTNFTTRQLFSETMVKSTLPDFLVSEHMMLSNSRIKTEETLVR